MSRAVVLRPLALVLAVAAAFALLGAALEVAGDAPLHAAGWAALAVLLAGGLGLQAARPGASAAGLQGLAAVALAAAVAGTLTADALFAVLALGLGLVLALLLVLHPRGGVAVTLPDTPSLTMLGLAIVAAVPFWAQASLAAGGREALAPEAPAGLSHWTALAAAAAAVPLVAAVAAVRAHGWPALAWCAGAAGALLAAASLRWQEEAGSMARASLTGIVELGALWPATALVWAVVFVGYAEWRRRVTRDI